MSIVMRNGKFRGRASPGAGKPGAGALPQPGERGAWAWETGLPGRWALEEVGAAGISNNNSEVGQQVIAHRGLL